MLQKQDVRSLTAHLASATKTLALYDDRAGAAVEVQWFKDEVNALTASGAWAEYLGSAFAAWADRILVLLTS